MAKHQTRHQILPTFFMVNFTSYADSFTIQTWYQMFPNDKPGRSPALGEAKAKGRAEAIGTTTDLDGLLESTRIEAAVLG